MHPIGRSPNPSNAGRPALRAILEGPGQDLHGFDACNAAERFHNRLRRLTIGEVVVEQNRIGAVKPVRKGDPVPYPCSIIVLRQREQHAAPGIKSRHVRLNGYLHMMPAEIQRNRRAIFRRLNDDLHVAIELTVTEFADCPARQGADAVAPQTASEIEQGRTEQHDLAIQSPKRVINKDVVIELSVEVVRSKCERTLRLPAKRGEVRK